MHGTPIKHRLYHHGFRKAIACAWINPEKYSTEEFEGQPEIPYLRIKRGLGLSLSCLVSTMTHEKDESASEPPQHPETSNVDDSNLTSHGGLLLYSEKIIYHLPDSSEVKARCILHGWFGIETHKDVIHVSKLNVKLCVLCYRLFNYNVDIIF